MKLNVLRAFYQRLKTKPPNPPVSPLGGTTGNTAGAATLPLYGGTEAQKTNPAPVNPPEAIAAEMSGRSMGTATMHSPEDIPADGVQTPAVHSLADSEISDGGTVFPVETTVQPGSKDTSRQDTLPGQGLHDNSDISAGLLEICGKYGIDELTLATDDGLVVATSAARDVEFDAVHYSQVVQLMTTPSEPDVSLFELFHKGSNLIGILRTHRHIHPILKEQIRDDTKVILQWWL